MSLYIFRQVAVAFAVVIGSIIGISWIIGSLQQLRWVINNGMPFAEYMYFNLLLIPINLTALMTPAAVIATLFVFNRLMSDNELVAMNAGGLGNMRMATAALSFVALLSAFLAFHLSYLSPIAYREMREIGFNVSNAGLMLNLKEMEFTSVSDEMTIYVGKRHSSSEFEDILVWETGDPEAPLAILADQAKLVIEHGRAFFVLFDGMQQSFDRETEEISISYFGQYTFNLEQYVEERRPPGADVRELLIGELWDKIMVGQRSNRFIRQANYRIGSVLKPFAIVTLALAILISGPTSRRGQTWRLVGAVAMMFAVEGTIAVLANTSGAVVAATFAILLVTFGLTGLGIRMIAKAPIRVGLPGWRFGPRRRASA